MSNLLTRFSREFLEYRVFCLVVYSQGLSAPRTESARLRLQMTASAMIGFSWTMGLLGGGFGRALDLQVGLLNLNPPPSGGHAGSSFDDGALCSSGDQ